MGIELNVHKRVYGKLAGRRYTMDLFVDDEYVGVARYTLRDASGDACDKGVYGCKLINGISRPYVALRRKAVKFLTGDTK